MSEFTTVNLRSLGQAQPVDTDYLLAEINQGSLLLLNQRPQAYGWEQHKVAERIVVIDGQVGIVAVDGREQRATVGEMVVIPAGLKHAYSADTDGVVVVLFGGQAPA